MLDRCTIYTALLPTRRSGIYLSVLLIASAGLLCFLTITSCSVTANGPRSPLSMSWVHTGNDTLSVFPSLTIAFSAPITMVAEFTVSPPVDNWYVHANAAHDTSWLVVTGLLSGNGRYVVRLQNAVQTADNVNLYPENDSIVFYTWACEQEPNNGTATADVLYNGRMDGELSVANDTDYVMLGDSTDRFLTVVSKKSRVGYILLDKTKNIIDQSFTEIDSQCITLNADYAWPLYTVVYSPLGVALARYELSVQ